jgi:hypothetical protein
VLAPRLVGARGPETVTDVVAAAIARVGLEEAPGDPVMTRLHRAARRRAAAVGRARGARLRRGLARLGRVAAGAGVGDTYAQLERITAGRPRTERDAVRLCALTAAVEDVRRSVGVPEDGLEDVPAPRVATRVRATAVTAPR